jgi:hypothetical protein
MRSGLPLFDRPKPSIETTEKEMEMADTAFQIQYRQETIAGFEQRQSYLRSTVVTEAEIKGNQARFLVADSGAATAVTRGTNGKIPSRTDNLTTATATLVEWHDKPVKTGFNIFASQGDGKRIMQDTTVGVMNRKIDSDIITTLATATQYAGLTALPASFSTIAYALALLGNNDIDTEDVDNLFFIMTPSFYSYIIQAPEWSSRDFVDMQPLVGPMRATRASPVSTACQRQPAPTRARRRKSATPIIAPLSAMRPIPRRWWSRSATTRRTITPMPARQCTWAAPSSRTQAW